MKFETEYTFEGKECIIKITAMGADTSVGIMSAGMENFVLIGPDGKEIELTDAQVDAIFDDESLQRKIQEEYERQFGDE